MTIRKPFIQPQDSPESDHLTFQLMFENHPASMLLIEPETGLILEANPAAVRFYGYPKPSLCGMLISENNSALAQAAIKQHKALGQQRDNTIFLHHLASGEVRNVEILSSPLVLHGEHLLFSIVNDITERNQAEVTNINLQNFRTAELVIANRELAFQNAEKEKRAAELVIANQELAFQNAEKEKRAAELVIARELVFQNEEKAKRADELALVNSYLENLINCANAPIIVWDPQFCITRFNHAFEFLTGRTEAEVLGQPVSILLPPANVKKSMAQIQATSIGGRWESVEIEIMHRDASIQTVLWNSATLFGADGQTAIATIAQGQNITRRKQVEQILQNTTNDLQDAVEQRDSALEELRNNEIDLAMQNSELRQSQELIDAARARYFDLYELAPVGYCTVSEKGLILEANLTATSLLGVPKTALIKKPFSFCIARQNLDIYYRHFRELFETGTARAFELQVLKKDGSTFWARLEIAEALDSNGAHMMQVVISEIGSLKKAEALLNERLKELSCLNYVSRLVFNLNLTKAQVCQKVIESLIPAMGYPQLAAAMISLDGKAYQSPNFSDSFKTRLTAPIFQDDQKCGQITVCYTQAGTPFYLPDEQNLLGNIAQTLSLWHERINSDNDVRKFSQAVEQSPISILIAKPDGVIEYANANFCALTGYSISEIIGKNARILQTGYTSQEEYQQLWNTILSGHVWEGKFLNRKKDGTLYWEKTSIAPMFDEMGQIIHFLALQENITAQKVMENDLRQSEAHNRALLDAIPDMIFRIRRDGVILDCNIHSNDPLIEHPDQLLGRSIYELVGDNLATRLHVLLGEPLPREQVESIEIEFKVKDSLHLFEIRFKHFGKNEVVAIVRDISVQSRLEQMKTDFINRARHELRTPITTMLLMVNLLDEKMSAENSDEYWEVLKSELNRERILVEHLLSASRMEGKAEQMNIRSLEIDALIQQVFRNFEPAAQEKGITLSVISMPAENGLPRLVQADQNGLTEVLNNLVGNAIKFTPSGGKISVQAQSVDKKIRISIVDTGMGIPSKDIPLLFTRFFRGSNAIEEEIQGTGLGLFIVRSILDQQGGKIEVLNEPGGGTRFDVWLPV